jgi:hypothetical protein
MDNDPIISSIIHNIMLDASLSLIVEQELMG